jgi:hypothetical protein
VLFVAGAQIDLRLDVQAETLSLRVLVMGFMSQPTDESEPI